MIKSYKEMPIGLFFRVQALILNEPDEQEWAVPVLALLTGRTDADLLNAPLTEFSSLMRQADFLCRPPETGRVKASYKAGDFDLVPTLQTNKVTAAQYIDFQSYCKTEDDAARVVGVLSCMLVPRGKRYCDGYDAGAVQDAIREHMTVEDALSLNAFFFDALDKSAERTLIYSERMLRRIEKMTDSPRKEKSLQRARTQLETLKRQRDSIAAGAGSLMSTPFQRLSAVLGMRFGL